MARIMFLFIIFLSCIQGSPLYSTVWNVGAGYTYTIPSSVSGLVSDGDTVEISAGYYEGDCSAWTANNLLLRATGGTVHLEAAGSYIWGKGIWVCAGNDIRVEGIEFSGATVPDHNGAGIRLDGIGLHVKNCYFHDNENGILGGNSGNILIEESEFGYNGYGDGYSHNIYINHADTLKITSCYIHHANIGHEIKSRAHVNIITYNRISNESTGRASREIDLSNGGYAIICGNLVHQGPMAENGNMIGYGSEGLTNNPPHHIYITNNTFTDQRHLNGRFLDIASGTGLLKAYNNIFAGGPAILLTGNPSTIDTAGNWICPDEYLAGFTGLSNYDYTLTPSSPAIGIGTLPGSAGSISLMPISQYVHPMQTETRPIAGNTDAGAYEYDPSPGITGQKNKEHDISYFRMGTTITFRSVKGFDEVILVELSGRVIRSWRSNDCHMLCITSKEISNQITIFQFRSKAGNQTLRIPIIK